MVPTISIHAYSLEIKYVTNMGYRRGNEHSIPENKTAWAFKRHKQNRGQAMWKIRGRLTITTRRSSGTVWLGSKPHTQTYKSSQRTKGCVIYIMSANVCSPATHLQQSLGGADMSVLRGNSLWWIRWSEEEIKVEWNPNSSNSRKGGLLSTEKLPGLFLGGTVTLIFLPQHLCLKIGDFE